MSHKQKGDVLPLFHNDHDQLQDHKVLAELKKNPLGWGTGASTKWQSRDLKAWGKQPGK